jgi:hypothetical protein
MRSVRPCLYINLLISCLILVVTIICSTLTIVWCEADCNIYLYAIVPMCFFSASLLGFAVWCKVTFEEPIETRVKISDPIPNLNSSYPFQYSMAHSSQFVPHSSTNRANLPANSVRDSQTSLYNQYRYAHEFEKRLLLEPRYLDENEPEPQNNSPFSNAQNSRSYVSQSTLNFATGGRWNSHPMHGPLR